MELRHIVAEAIFENPEVVVEKDGLIYQIAEVFSQAGVLHIVCFSLPVERRRFVRLVDWCRTNGVNSKVAKDAAGKGRIPFAWKQGEGKRGIWMIPEDSTWRPEPTRGRPWPRKEKV